jgi:hypothetical protein
LQIARLDEVIHFTLLPYPIFYGTGQGLAFQISAA